MRTSSYIIAALVVGPALGLAAPAAVAQRHSTPAAAEGEHAQATKRALDDPTIIAIFDAANTADIETGKLAAERGNSAEVKAFGAMLMHDHEQVRQMGRDLAAKLHVTPTPPVDDAGGRAHAAAMKELRALSGADFDRAFLKHEVAFHASVIDAVKTTLLPAIQNAELKALVVKVAPAFEGHRAAAAQMAEKLAAKGGR